jgi:two-component system, cell cycle sensor histidine kinase and response regulator CckA
MRDDRDELQRELEALRAENARLRGLEAELERTAEALRRSERFIERLLDSSPHLIFIKDAEGHFLLVNRAMADLFRVPREEIADPASDRQYAPRGEVEMYERLDREVIATGQPRVVEEVYTTPSGETMWFHTVRVPFVHEDGTVHVLGLATDISERRRAEEALRASEARLQAAFESLPFEFWVCDADGRYVLQSPVSVKNWGEQIGQRPEEADVPEPLLRTWRENNRRALAGEVVEAETETVVAGETRHTFSVLAPIREGGAVRGFLGVNIDITERKRMERALRESEERLARTEAFSLVMVTHIALDGRWLKVPPTLLALLGLSESEMLALRVQDVTHAADRDLDWAQCERLIRGEIHSYDLEKRLTGRAGRIVWVYVNGSVVLDAAGRPVHLLAYIRDITEQKRLEEQFLHAQKMESVGRLAGGIAHDFNNLLTAILGTAQLAHQAHDALQAQTYLKEIQEAAERGAGLTRRLLAFARRQSHEPRVVRLNDVLMRLETLLRRIGGEGVRLEMRLASEPGNVKMDPAQFEQVLLNLAANARDAMPEGGALTVETARLSLPHGATYRHARLPSGEYALVSVRDVGTGMSPKAMEHLFEPFFTTKEPGRGTGLGLATCYGVVRQNGGYIWCHSEPGEGTTFCIALPRVSAAPEATPGIAEKLGGLRGCETVLVAEDEPTVRSVVARALRLQGYRVIEAPDGETALWLAAEHRGPIDLLVADVVMPGLGGIETAARLRERFPAARVLYLSGYSESAVVEGHQLGSGVSFLQKPFDLSALARKVRQALDGGSGEE